MKRHKSLIPLSRDHHRALLLAQLLKKDAPPYKGLPHDNLGKQKYLLEKWEKELKPHFINEEEVLFPSVNGKDSEIDDLVSELIAEHEELENLIEKNDSSTSLEERLDQIGKTLERHIRKEERILFQQLQIKCETELLSLQNKISESNSDCEI